MRLRTLAAALAAAAILGASHAFAAGPGTGTSTFQCAPYQVVAGGAYPGTGGTQGGGYIANADGLVTVSNSNDIHPLLNAGCDFVGVQGLTLIGTLAANMNVTTDQKVTMYIAPGAYYIPSYMIVKDCSVSLTTAQGAVYDAASKGGNTLFGSGTTQAFTACTGAGTAQPISATTGGTKIVDAQTSPPILSLTTAQGATATANVYFYGYVLGQ
jgi:hypothetical protein